MNINAFINWCVEKSISFSLEGNDQLKVNAAPGALTADIISQLKERKSDIINWLQNQMVKRILLRPASDKNLSLSYAQQRLWLLNQIDGGGAHYNMPGALKLIGVLNEDALNKAFNSIFERHESLRTCFAIGDDEQPHQIIQAPVDIKVPLIDLSMLEESARQSRLAEIVEEDANHVFDLRKDLMLRAQLIKLADEEHALLVNMHHIASDGWSMSILINEFSTLYSAYVQGLPNPLTPLAIQYADYAYWQRNWLKGEVLEQQLDYWTKQLAGLPVVHNLPSDYPRPPQKTFAGKTYVSQIDSAVIQKLKTLCQQEDGTLFMGLHAAFSAFLSRYSNETDIVMGSPIANREQAEIAGLIGFFVNTLVLRSDLSSNPTFAELLRQSKSNMVNAYAYQQVPFEQIVEQLQPERSLSYSSLFQIMLVLQNNEQGELALPGLTLSSVAQSSEIAKYDLRLDITDTQDGLFLQWEYSTDLFELATVERMAKHFEILLKAYVDSPNESVFAAEIIDLTERQQLLVEWNATAVDFPKDKCIHELFEAQVEKNPNATAVTFENQTLSYQQLNEKANQLAHYLISDKQIKPDALVGICVERSLEMVVGILAILKAGGAYVPLDPEYPEARLKYMLGDANLSTVLTQRHLREKTPVSDEQALCLDSDIFTRQLETYSVINPDLTSQGLTSKHLAYVIYTSGSTGNPKGVMVEHLSLVNRIDWMDRQYGSSPSDRILQKTPFSFDVSVWEFVWPLSVGASIVLAKPEGHKDPVYLSAFIRDQHITKLHFVPSMLGSILALGDLSQCTSLQHVFCSGEALALHHVEEFQSVCPWAELHNLYGPTEAAIDVSYWDCSQSHVGLNSVPIGRPISNIQLHILNSQLIPVPQNVAGELHIGGVGLARGYLNRADLSAEKFIANPFYDKTNPASSERLYKTGDLVRWLADGNVEFLGRIDHQVKIRGFRIELGEIENALSAHDDVDEAVVLAKESEAGDTQLLAYIVPNENLQKVEHVVDVNATTFMFDDMYKNSLLENNEDPYSNFVGWNSSYDSQPIPLEEMEAWRTATVNRILELKPKRVLEIGIGSGLLFWKIVPACESYWGTDLSNATLQKLQAVLNHHPELSEKVELRQQEALDFSGLPSNFFDTVIINSVVQYFPDINYLTQVLQSAVNLIIPNGNIFIGDVRNLRLLPVFQTAVQVSRADDDLSLNLIKKLINTSVRREEELLLDPEFFDGFKQTAARISGVDLQVKAHLGNNELTQYRYDVVLRVDALTTVSAKQFESLVWGHDLTNLDELRLLLSGNNSTVSGGQSKGLRIRNVPNQRIAAHNGVRRQFEKATNLEELKALLNTVKQSAFDIEAFAHCALDTGHILRVTWARKGYEDLLDLIFINAAHLTAQTALIDVYDSEWSEDSSLYHYVNNPRLGSLHIKLINSLRDYVQQHLPDYMEPNNFVIMDALPLTPNGKVDRKTLMASDVEYLQTTYVAPRTETEKVLCEIWQEVLGVERVGVMDNFFQLGGHSLSATRVVARINQTLNVSLVLKELFNTQTLEGLAQAISRLDPNLARPALVAIARDEVLLPSFNQQRLWLLDKIDQGSAHYNMPSALKLTGKLDYQALNKAFDSILDRHESLRTCFAIDAQGQPTQLIQAVTNFQVPITDLSVLDDGERQLKLAEFVVEESSGEFDLSSGLMLRAQLIKVAADEHVLLVTMHHIASDGWSMSVLINEFSALYGAYSQGQQNPLAPLAIQYADYAHWQRNWLQGEVLEQQLGYWEKQLAGLPVAHSLPLDHPRPAIQSFVGATYNSQVDVTTSKALIALCQSQGATLFMGLHAAFSALLSRYSNETDIVIGSPIANREQAEVAGLIGFFVNTLVLRSDLSESPSFKKLINQSKNMLLDAYAYQQVPFEQIVERLQPERSLNHSALFQVMLVLQNNEQGILELPGLTLSPVGQSGAGIAKYDLTLSVAESEQGLLFGWEYNTDLFEANTIARMANHFELLLKTMLAIPEQNVFKVEVLGVQERQQLLVDWNNTQVDYPNDKCIHELFEAQVETNPNAIAVIFEDKQLTYAELNKKSNQLAHYLINEKHITPDTLVGICVERSLEMVVGILAILKSGGAYVPLDPEYPEARLKYMLDDAQLTTVLTQSHLRETTPVSDMQAVCLDSAEIQQQLQTQSTINPELKSLGESGLTSNSLAYVIYTSGSTGNPKGVMVEHHALVNRIDWMDREYGSSPSDRILQKTPFSFDVSVWEFVWPLSVGASIVLAKPEGHKDPVYLSGLIRDQQITKLHFVPSMLGSMLALGDLSQCTSLQQVFCSGEALALHHVKEFQAMCPWAGLHNLYGPTEAAIDVSYWDCAQLDAGLPSVPIGRPISNIQLHVLNPQLTPVPQGVAGELHIGGVGLARGYLNRADLTAEKFVPNPFYDKTNPASSERLYKTGDLVRWLPDGNLEYLGRIDHQVKIRGFRIELGEIENTLSSHAAVTDAVVLAKESASTGDKRLVAYVVTGQQDNPELVENLRHHLHQTLPDYMVPGAFVLLDSLPLTPNGKVDRKALPEPDLSTQQNIYIAPTTETEKILCEIWQEVLGVERVGINDNFFHLGGHSLLAVRLATNLEKVFAKSVPLRTILLAPSVSEQVKFLQETKSDALIFEEITPDIENQYQPFPLTDIQQAYWIGRGGDFELGNISTHMYIEVPIFNADAEKLQRTLNRMIERHGMLRMVINPDGQQQILENVPEYQLATYDLTAVSDADAGLGILALREELSHQILPTDCWPLFDFRLSQLSGQRAILHVSVEVLVLDGSSMGIFSKEFETLYLNPEQEIAPLNLSFRDYVLAEQALTALPIYQQSKHYWMERLSDFPSKPALPLAIDPAHIKTPRFERREHTIDADRWKNLKNVAQSHHLTPTALLLGCMGEVLNAWSDQAHFILNLTLFNRLPFHAEVNDILGDFTSLTLLEMDYRNAQTLFVDRLRAVQDQLWKDLENRYFGGVAVQRALRMETGHAASFPVVFTSVLGLNKTNASENDEQVAAPTPEQQNTDSLMNLYSLSQTSQVWLDIQVFDVGEGLGCNWDSVEGLFPDGMLDEMFAAVWTLLDKLGSSESHWFERTLIDVSPTTHELIKLTNATSLPIQSDLLHAPLLEKIASHGEKIAVRTSEKQLSYTNLGQRSQALASQLISGGAAANKLIAIVLDKGWEQVVAVLGILTSGAAYLPIDASQPKERIQRLLTLGQVEQVVTVQAHVHLLPTQLRIHVIDEKMPCDADVSLLSQARSTPSDIAYVIFTSGSSGEPKGVTITHEAALNTVLAINECYQISERDNVFGLSNLNFDLSVFDIFGVLGAGGTLVLPSADEYRNPSAWISYLTSESDPTQNITLWNTVPALMQLLVEECEHKSINLPLRMVMMSGDWIPIDLPKRISAVAPQAQQMSLGGATEVSIWSIHYPITEVDSTWTSIPYGQALPNQQVYVLKNDLSFAPIWVTGDIYIGGVGLAVGYWQDSEKTANSFITHPVSGERLYKTGDQGRLLADGNIEFKGRVDSQVKIRGYRIELGEIEARLKNHSLVNEALVTKHQSVQSQQLVAYVTGYSAESDLTINDLSVEEKLAFKMSLPSIRKLDGKTIDLPSIEEHKLPISLTMPSMRNVDSKAAISVEEIAKLLQVFHRKAFSELPFPKAFYPSGGTLYPVQVYLGLSASLGAELAGYYYYNPLAHQLIRVGDIAQNAEQCLMPLQLFLVADFASIEPLYGDLSNALCQAEAGYMAQLIESSLISSIALTRVNNSSNTIHHLLKLNKSHRVLQVYEGGMCAELETQTASIVLNHANRKSYRAYEGVPALEGLSHCLSVLQQRNTLEPLCCRYYVYLRRECSSLTGSVLVAGVYRYDAENNLLTLINAGANDLLSIGENILIEAGSGFVVLMVNHHETNINNALFESGFNGQALSNKGMTLGLGFCAIGNLDQHVARKILHLSPEDMVVHALIGGTINAQQMDVVANEKSPMNVEKILSDYVKAALPEYMAPTFYVLLDQIPLTANGKVDRKSLPEPDLSILETAYVAPRNPTEEILCAMWEKVLNVDSVGVNDNFFKIGGNSLLAIRLVSEIRERFVEDSIEISLRFVFENPFVAAFSEFIAMKVKEQKLKQNELNLVAFEDAEIEEGIL